LNTSRADRRIPRADADDGGVAVRCRLRYEGIMTQAITVDWVGAAVNAASDDQVLAEGVPRLASPVQRLDALLRAWPEGFCARRPDVETAAFRHGRRGLHPDECAAFLRALDQRLLHVDSAGYVVPLCAAPKPGQKPYALCCKDGAGVGVNLEYVIQLGVLAELATQHRYPNHQLRMELGEFDAAALNADGSPAVLMEAKARATGGSDTLDRLLLKWLRYADGPTPQRGENAANKYVELNAVAQQNGPVTVLLVAAGAHWWITAEPIAPDRLRFTTTSL
jgi:hypothetical protein